MRRENAVAAGSTGLPWPDVNHSGTMSLLQTLRTAAGAPVGAPAFSVVLPVPGDVRGLPAGTQFQRDAITAGEAIVVGCGRAATGVGLVPDFEYDDAETYDDAAEQTQKLVTEREYQNTKIMVTLNSTQTTTVEAR